MNPLLILAAAATLGVEVGWQPLAEGGHEYTIQVEPQLLDVLKRGSDIVSEVPPQLDIRRYRITIGTGQLARVDGQPRSRLARPDDRAAEPGAAGPKRDAIPDAPAETGIAGSAKPTEADPTAAPTEADTARSIEKESVPPAALPAESSPSKPLSEAQPAAHHAPVEEHNAQKPELDAGATEPQRPWVPLSVAVVLLCCSLGGNLYLGWIAAEARKRYRQVTAQLRAS